MKAQFGLICLLTFSLSTIRADGLDLYRADAQNVQQTLVNTDGNGRDRLLSPSEPFIPGGSECEPLIGGCLGLSFFLSLFWCLNYFL